ncbi:MAG: hypothetical protein N4A44_03040 [Alphaproteobacteria bacterium]|jgi:hypothetical protein|nr:hypothetical protein [Alphaproteobacteria bacterium]
MNKKIEKLVKIIEKSILSIDTILNSGNKSFDSFVTLGINLLNLQKMIGTVGPNLPKICSDKKWAKEFILDLKANIDKYQKIFDEFSISDLSILEVKEIDEFGNLEVKSSMSVWYFFKYSYPDDFDFRSEKDLKNPIFMRSIMDMMDAGIKSQGLDFGKLN